MSADGALATPEGERQLSRRLAAILRLLITAEGTAVASEDLLTAGNGHDLSKAVFRLRQALDGTKLVRIESVYSYGYRLRVGAAVPRAPNRRSQALAICDEAAHRIYDSSGEALGSALAMYEKAWQLDPTCLPAYHGYAQLQNQLLATGQASSISAWEAIQGALENAVQHAPPSADVHAVLAKGHYLLGWDAMAGREHLAKALRLDSAAYLPNECAGRISLFLGNAEQAVDYLKRAIDANPLVMAANGCLAYALGCTGEGQAAVDHIDWLLEVDPRNVETRGWYTWVHAVHGDADRACRIATALSEQLPDSATNLAGHAVARARAGQWDQARLLLDSLADQRRFANRGAAIASYAWYVLGDRAAALGALETAARERDYWLGFILQRLVHTDLQSEPAFQGIHSRVYESSGLVPA